MLQELLRIEIGLRKLSESDLAQFDPFEILELEDIIGDIRKNSEIIESKCQALSKQYANLY